MAYQYEPYKWWVNNVLPLVYDDSLSYYEVLSKLKYYVDGLVGDVNRLTQIVNTIEGIGDIEQFTEMLNQINAKIGELENLQTTDKSDIVSAINSVVFDLGITKLEVEGKYTKPTAGIPESDLSDELREKINEQFVEDKNYNNLSNKPKINHIEIEGDHEPGYYGIGTYNKPESGIPESDLAQGIVDKLNETIDNTEKIDGIAPSVDTYTADRRYEVGELVFIGGKLYRVTKTVYQGTAFQIGNNIEGTTVNNELEDISAEINNIKIAIGAESYDINSGEITTNDINIYTLFFRYFYAKANEEYLFIVTPNVSTNNAGYNINIYNENGEVVYTFNSGNGVGDYKNERRFTFTPSASGNYYCGIKKDINGGNYPVVQTVKLQYTATQSAESIVQIVSELIPRVEGVEGDVAGLETAIVGAITYAEFNGGTLAGNQSINTACYFMSGNVADLPDEFAGFNRRYWLLTIGNNTLKFQIIYGTVRPGKGIYYRTYSSNSWGEWVKIVNPITFYPTGDDTIRTTEFLQHYNNYESIVKLAPGDYYIQSIAMPEGAMLIGSGTDNTRIIVKNPTRWYGILMRNKCVIKDLTVVLDGGFGEANLPTVNYSDGVHGVAFGSNTADYDANNRVEAGRIENVNITGFTGCGIFGRSNTMKPNGFNVRNVRITYCSSGIYFGEHSEYNEVSDSYVTLCYTGIVNMGGNNIYSNSVFSENERHVVLKENDAYTTGGSNDAHGIFTGCKLTHGGYFTNTNGNCETTDETNPGGAGGYAIIREQNSSLMLFSGCLISNNIYAYRGGQALFLNGCCFRGSDTSNYMIVADGALICITGCVWSNYGCSVNNNGKVWRRSCLTYQGATLDDVIS